MGNATAVLTAERGTRVRFGARTAESAAVAVLSFAAVGGLAAGSGGYFPNNWAWASLAFAWLAASAAWLRIPSPFGRSALVLLGSLIALAAWTLASLLWAPSGEPLFASERLLVYVTAVAAAVIAVRHRTVPHLLGGTLAGLVAVDAYALATRLLPDHVGGQDVIAANRLAAPIGYWNGLGLASAFALLLALGFATRSHSLASRACAAATLPGLFVVLYFTFSRGSWLALFGGVAVLLLVDPRRLQLATVGGAVSLPAAIAGVLAWHAHALGEQGGTLAATVREGHHLGLAVAALSVVGGAVGAAAGGIERHASIRGRARLVYALVLLLLAVSAVALALARIGGPVGAIEHGWRSFTAPPIQVENGQQESKRLLSLSSNGRIDLWRSAWHEARAHPLLGGGAGSYEAWWMQHRPVPQQVRDAHSLYLQTLAEVGPLGLALLLAALCAPLLAAARNRRRPYVSFALAVWVAYLLHTGADWDWQLTGVTLPALLAATALVVTDRDEVAGAGREPRAAPRTRCRGSSGCARHLDAGREHPTAQGDDRGRRRTLDRVGGRGAGGERVDPLDIRAVATSGRGPTRDPEPSCGPACAQGGPCSRRPELAALVRPERCRARRSGCTGAFARLPAQPVEPRGRAGTRFRANDARKGPRVFGGTWGTRTHESDRRAT